MQKAGTLSGGEQQMCAIGRALMAQPKLLHARRAVAGPRPDPRRADLRHRPRDQQEGTTILLVEQNALIALAIANRGYVLETGHVALHDTAEALRKNEQVRKAYLGET